MEDHAIIQLLKEVTSINKRYKEVTKATGANFNIFSVLRVQNDEVRLHSRFIGELLNPKGRHDQGPLFLSLFIQVLGINNYNENQLANTKVIIEEYIGEVSKDYSKGGNIDIVIKPENGKKIIIENKIFAGEQKNQLIRYKEHYPDDYLFYLTLNGTKPNSTKDEKININLEEGIDKDFVCISYANHIIKWLENCQKESVSFPMLRETITQYIIAIKSLTGQAMNNRMSDKIVETIIKDADNIESAFLLSNLDKVKQSLAKKFEEQVKKIAQELNLSLRFSIKQFDDIYEGFMLFHPDLDKDSLAIVFQFLQPSSKVFIYGIMKTNYDITNKGKIENRNFRNISNHNITSDNFIKNNLESFKKLAGLDLNSYVAIAYTTFQGIENWNGKEFGEIASGDMIKRIEEKIRILVDAFSRVDPERYQFKALEKLENSNLIG